MKTILTTAVLMAPEDNAGGGGAGGNAGGDPGPNGGGAVHPIHDMNADSAKAYVADQALEDLDAVEAAEHANPKNPGGRKSVLAAIADRRAKLTPPVTEHKDLPGPSGTDAAFDIMPEVTGHTSDKALDLLLEACETFGVHPGRDQRPRELASWRWYPGERLEGVPDAVVIVTSGGRKLKHFADPNYPMDADTEEQLRTLFNAFQVNPVTKLPEPKALPPKLLLPDIAVTGIEPKGERPHRYVGGYLRNGGKAEAARRGRT